MEFSADGLTGVPRASVAPPMWPRMSFQLKPNNEAVTSAGRVKTPQALESDGIDLIIMRWYWFEYCLSSLRRTGSGYRKQHGEYGVGTRRSRAESSASWRREASFKALQVCWYLFCLSKLLSTPGECSLTQFSQMTVLHVLHSP